MFVNLFRSILPVVQTECDVLIVCRQHNDKEWKLKEQHAKMWENTVGAKSYSRPRGFNIAGASDPAVPTPLKATKPGCSFFVFSLHCSTFRTGLSVEESIRMTEDRDILRKYVHGVANPRIEDG